MKDKWKFRGWDAVGNKGWVYGDLVHNKRVDLTDRVMVFNMGRKRSFYL